MGEPDRGALETYYRNHQLAMALALLCVVSLAGYTVVDLSGRAGRVSSGVGGWIILAAFFVAVAALRVVTAWRSRLRLLDPDAQAIFRDEWVRENRNRAKQTAFVVMLTGQAPMMYLMTGLPAERSLTAMGTLSLLLGLAAFFASYLYFSRQPSDG